jgi:hypothetical protein
MAIASFVLAIVAVLIALASAAYSARQASAAEGALAIELARRREELRPRLMGWIAWEGRDGVFLWMVLEFHETLEGADLYIPPGQGMSFRPYASPGVHPPWREEKESYHAYTYNLGGPGEFAPHRPMRWWANLTAKPGTMIRVVATCHGKHAEHWESIIEVEVPDGPPDVNERQEG